MSQAKTDHATILNYEKLGLFYLGRILAENGESVQPMLLRSRDLTTHGVIIGMTGSGKTGLGIALIEEAIMDDIPAIVIDPKGDMGNLLLTFPELEAGDFKPWLEQAEAERKGFSLEQYAEDRAQAWREGLAKWGQQVARVGVLREKSEITIYTPGGGGGVPVSVLNGFDPPPAEIAEDPDTLNDLVTSAVSGLLALLQIEADPMQSREHILLSSILLHHWQKGESLDLEGLIGAIVSPPFARVGAFGLDTYYKQADRMNLAMRFNNVLASPSFSGWIKGEPLDIQRLLYRQDGRPRTAIFSISHLADTERMFFVTLLLNSFVAWMRRQRGSSSLKTLLYMDEIFGFFPPTANPPSKKPMLLLLKQARAFGCGVVLSTQNPVDLDYRGLANMGSWFVGRLQTEQDRKKVAGGIAGASEGRLSEPEVAQLLATMQGRQFLLNSAHQKEPVAFETRWVMSFLKGPLSGSEIETLMREKLEGLEESKKQASSGDESLAPEAAETMPVESGSAPILAGRIEQRYYLPNLALATMPGSMLRPAIGACAKVRLFNAARNIDEVREVRLRYPLTVQAKYTSLADLPWGEAKEMHYTLADCLPSAPSGCSYSPLPADICSAKNLGAAEKGVADHLYRNERLELLRVKSLKLESTPHESPADFKVRLRDELRERKDLEVEKLKDKYDLRQQRLQKKLQTAQNRVQREEEQVRAKTTDTLLAFGAAVVGTLFGNRSTRSGVSGLASGVRKAGRVFSEKDDVELARRQLEQVQQEILDLAVELEQEMSRLEDSFMPESYQIETFTINPRRKDIYEVRCALVWELAGGADAGGETAGVRDENRRIISEK